MLKPQKKISKKEIKEDKLVTGYFEAREWAEANKRTVMYIVAIPVVIAAGWFFWHQKQADANERASTMLAKIEPYYEQGKYDLAINGVPQEGAQGLQNIVDENGSSQAGQFAKLFLANSYYMLKNYDKALQYYDDVSIHDKMMTASAAAGVAACYEAKGNLAEAASYFEKAASKNMVELQAPENLEKAARDYAAVGKKEKAVELLQTLKKEFPASTYARDVDRFIAEYGS